VSAHTIGPQTESTAAAPTTADAVEASDSVLLSRARLGDDGAFAALWRRNLPAAYGAATRFRGRVSPEDLVAEASARMLRLIREGNGPSENFRSYFMSTVRTVGVDAVRREMSIVPTDTSDLDRIAVADKDLSALGAEGVDTDLVRAAFRQLSESDRQLLWHTMVEGDPPRVVAPLLGVSANVVSARAMRARDELRARYLDVWVQRRVPVCGEPECRWTLDHLSGHVRGRLTARQRERAEAHLAHCTRDARLAVELRRVYDGFGVLTGPIVLAAGAAMAGTLQHGTMAGLIGSTAAGTGAAAGTTVAGTAAGTTVAGTAAGTTAAGTAAGGVTAAGTSAGAVAGGTATGAAGLGATVTTTTAGVTTSGALASGAGASIGASSLTAGTALSAGAAGSARR